MRSLIACNDEPLAAKLRVSLANLGIECTLDQVASHDSVRLFIEQLSDNQSYLVFFASPQLSDEDISSLRRICAACTDKVKVVVVGSNFGAAGILQAVRNGALDCLSLESDFEEELRHLLDRLRLSSGTQGRRGRLFTVVSAVGGAGASIISINLAASFATRHQQCSLLDLHVRGGDLATLLNSSPRHNLLSLAGKTEQLDRTMLEQSMFKHECGIHLLASGELFSDWRLIRPELIHKIVQLSRSAYEAVVVDLEDLDHSEQVRTLAMSDHIIVPLRADFVSLCRTKKVLDFWRATNVCLEHVTLVLNRAGQPKELPLKLIEEALDAKVTHQIADDPVTINAAINLGTPLVIAFPKSKAAKDIEKLSDSLLGVPEPTVPAKLLAQMREYGSSVTQTFKSAAGLFG